MKRFQIFSLVILLCLPPALLSSQVPGTPAAMQSSYGEKVHIEGVPNAGKIDQHLYRGAQPKLLAVDELKKLGVTTVVDLRSEDPQAVTRERAQVQAQGLRFVSIPIGGFSAPTNQQVIQFLEIFRDHPDEIVFVHCHYGEDRTGVFVASYRMTMEHWPARQAENEMDFFGFHRHWQREMKDFVRDYPARLSSAPDLANFQKTLTSAGPLPLVH
jgi:tyrosine-protein phosphatase SIW14